MSDPLMTTDEVAHYLKVHRITVLRMIRRGDIAATKIGRHWRIRRAEIDRYIRQNDKDADQDTSQG